MFSVVFVCHAFCPQAGRSHMTITSDALELTVQGFPLDMGPQGPLAPLPSGHGLLGTSPGPSPNPLLVTSGGHHWRLVKPFYFRSPLLGLTSGGRWSRYGQRKQAVHILLECFLVLLMISHYSFSKYKDHTLPLKYTGFTLDVIWIRKHFSIICVRFQNLSDNVTWTKQKFWTAPIFSNSEAIYDKFVLIPGMDL